MSVFYSIFNFSTWFRALLRIQTSFKICPISPFKGELTRAHVSCDRGRAQRWHTLASLPESIPAGSTGVSNQVPSPQPDAPEQANGLLHKVKVVELLPRLLLCWALRQVSPLLELFSHIAVLPCGSPGQKLDVLGALRWQSLKSERPKLGHKCFASQGEAPSFECPHDYGQSPAGVGVIASGWLVSQPLLPTFLWVFSPFSIN